MLERALSQVIEDFAVHRQLELAAVEVSAPDAWQVHAAFQVRGQGTFVLRNLRDDDLDALCRFGAQLGPVSRDLFAPYPWEDPARCAAAFQGAIAQAVQRIDASYLLVHNGAPIGHAFLWRAGGNPVSLAVGLAVPELGVAVADAYHGQGLGGLAVRALLAVARSLQADAVELTTAPTNASGWRVYQRAGFEEIGMLRIPLDVDVTAVELGLATASRFREERHMVCCLKPATRDRVLAYLAGKRTAANGTA